MYQAIVGTQMGLRSIAAGYWEDREGVAYVLNPQRGWVRVDGASRGLRMARMLRVLLRHRKDDRAKRVAARMGKWATWDLELGYSS